jgi:uncharacterized protein
MDAAALEWIYTASGFAVGLIVGLTGVGGGSLMTPLLVLGFGIAPATAVGTDLLYAAMTKAGGSVAHARHGTVHWRLVGLLALGSVPSSLVTTLLLRWLGTSSAALSSLLTTTLGVALILTAGALLLRRRLQELARRQARNRTGWRERHLSSITVVVGLLLGVLVTISSVGAGALGTVALLFLYPGLQTREIVGTDIAHAVPLTLVAGLGHAVLGTVDYVLLGTLLLGSLPGIWIGSHLSARLPERYVRAALATILLVVGGKFVY